MLISALLPASEAETRAGQRAPVAVQDHGQPLVDHARSVGDDIGQDLGDSASEAAEKVKSQAQDSASTVKGEGQSSVGQVKEQATPSS